MAPTDCMDLKQVARLVGIRGLAVTHFPVIGVKCVGAYKVRGSRHVSLNQPLEAMHRFVGSVVGHLHDVVLACLVPVELVLGLSPSTVLLADWRVTQLQLYGFVGRVCSRW